MTQIDIAALVEKLSSQIGDDIQVIFNHESLFKQARAALIAQDAELKRLTARAEAAEAILSDAGALRDAADLVSAWFATEAWYLEGPRINGLRMAMIAYDRHMQPAPRAAVKEVR